MGTSRPSPSPSFLPTPRTSLIGRDAERAQARALLLDEGVPLLTLVGPGGVGKTRLALAIAQDTGERFVDGVAWVDLAPLTDPRLVTATLAVALAPPPKRAPETLDALVRHLRARQVLLLMDNCEHLLAGVAELVASLLAHCPAVQVLATSRAPLRIRGEQQFPVRPLSLPEDDAAPMPEVTRHAAIQLFTARASAQQPGFHLTTGNALTVAALCRALDGLPLAIELAAARMSMLSPAALLLHVREGHEWAGSAPRDLPPRQQTVTAAAGWSYHLLEAETQCLLRRLAVFAGSFTLEAAQAITGIPGTEHRLTSLVEQSLVQRADRDEQARFSLLETIRVFALARLGEAGEEPATRDAHAAWFLALAEESHRALVNPEQPQWLRMIDADRDNLRSAFDWLLQHRSGELAGRLAAGLTVYWFQRDAFLEGQTALRAARACGDLPPDLVVDLLDSEATFAHYAGDYARTEQLAQALLAHGQEHDDPKSEALGHSFMSKALGARGPSTAAVDHAEQALRYFRLAPHPHDLPLAINRLALELSEIGAYERAHELYEEVLALWGHQGDTTGTIMALANFGALHWRMGQRERALANLQESLRLSWDRQVLASCAEALAGIAAIAADLGWHHWTVCLLGVVDTLCARTCFTLYSWSREFYGQGAAGARRALGESGFRDARDLARHLEPAQAVTAACSFSVHAGPPPLPIAQPVQAGPTAPVELTPREQEVLAFLCARQTNSEIADHLFLSTRTVESHVRNILGKLGAENRREAAAIAVRLHLA